MPYIVYHQTDTCFSTFFLPPSDASRAHHSDPKYEEMLYINTKSKRWLCAGTDWYRLFEKMAGTHCVLDKGTGANLWLIGQM